MSFLVFQLRRSYAGWNFIHLRGERLWGMYVTPSHRGQRFACELLAAALAHAATLRGVSWVHLWVSSAAPAAKRFYERAGFQLWGREPDAMRHDGRTVVDYHMALNL